MPGPWSAPWGVAGVAGGGLIWSATSGRKKGIGRGCCLGDAVHRTARLEYFQDSSRANWLRKNSSIWFGSTETRALMIKDQITLFILRKGGTLKSKYLTKSAIFLIHTNQTNWKISHNQPELRFGKLFTPLVSSQTDYFLFILPQTGRPAHRYKWKTHNDIHNFTTTWHNCCK